MDLKLKMMLATDVGPARERNEDAAAITGQVVQHDHGAPISHDVVVRAPLRIVVCDGMGGHRGGRDASFLASQRLSIPLAEAEQQFQDISDLLVMRGEQDPELEGMGTTAVVLEVRPDGSASILHVGDSRAYLADPELARLTHDDRVSPDLTTLTQALGGRRRTLNVHRYDFTLFPGQRILLCSDGLADTLTDQQIEQALHSDNAACQLIVKALEAPAQDNVTVAVVEVLTSPKARVWRNK